MRLLKLQLLSIILLVVIMPDSTMARNFDFADWNALLKKYVAPNTIDETKLNTVNYKELRSDPAFEELVKNLELFILPQFRTHAEKLSFWINVYNVFAVKIITENYPVKSIKDIGGLLFNSVWKNKAGVIGGKGYSLNEIEHQILRKMGDPRIHFAIVCASVSCPDLATYAFSIDRLNEQLDARMKDFLANPGKGVRLDVGGNRVFLSSIFDWFEEDFEEFGGVLKFIQPHVSIEDRQALRDSSLQIFYMEYNWRLNDSPL